MLMSVSVFTVSAQSETAAGAEETEGVISLPFVDYVNEISSGRDTAYLENVIKDGKDVVMCTPNPKSQADTSTITIDGYKYKPVNINLDEYQWIALEYFYQAHEPVEDLRMNIALTGLGNLLKEGMGAEAKSQDVVIANTWAIALFDMTSVIDTALNPEVSHILQQLHVQPYGRNTRSLLKETDIMYISRIMFFKEQPAFNSHTPYMNGYTDGTFKPAGTMTRAEAETVVARLLEAVENIAGTPTFTDTVSHWAAKYIGFCEAKGLLGSYSGSFLPDQPITRAEFAELVYLTGLAEDKGITASFTDVAESHPKYASIMAAAKAGLINGYLEADNTYTFKPDNTITRAEVVTVINRARNLSRKPEQLTDDITVLFMDVDYTHWAFADIAEATVPHVESGDAWLYPVKDPVLALEEKIGTASLYDTAVGYAKVAELDALEAQRIAEIRNTPNADLSGITGNKIYVSNNGNDENDGLTPETAVKTVAKANSLARSGDAVLFERGGIWRGEVLNAKANVMYTAYGEGAKPQLYGSTENGADPEKWGLVYENPETGARIWQYHYDGWLDVGTIVFNEGEGYAYKDIPNNKLGGGDWVVYKTNTPYDYTVELDRNFEFFHKADSVVGGSYIDAANARGPIYLRCDNGNPGKIFDSIEFVTRGALISCGGNANVTIDNLCIKYSAFGISTGTIKNFTVTNCEFGWIGGNVQSYETRKGEATRYGNAIEVYGGCDGYTVDNCYFYQIYDAAVTHQIGSASTPLEMNNITYSNNVMDMCQYSIEYFFGSDVPGKRTGTNVLFENNLCRRAGFGFGSTRRDQYTQRHIRAGASRNEFSNFRINNNVFDRAVFELVQTNCHDEAFVPTYDGNTFIQGANNQLFSHGVGKVAKTDASAEIRLKAVLGDQNAKVYFVDNIPMYKFEFNYDKTAPVTEDDKRTFESTLGDIDPAKIYIPDGETDEITEPLLIRSQRTKSLYSTVKNSMIPTPKTDSNGIVYNRITFNSTSDRVLFDCYGLPKYSVDSPALYYKLLVRTNHTGVPNLTVYGLQDENGENAGSGVSGTSKAKLKANGEWEEVIIQVLGIPAEAATSNQVHLLPLGGVNGSSVLGANPNAYLDFAAWAVFSNLASAEAYDIMAAAGKTEGAPDNVEVELPEAKPTTPDTQGPTIGEDEIVEPLVVRTQRTKSLGQGRNSMVMEPKTDDDGTVYSHITFNNTADRILMDCYGLPKYAVNSKGVYYKMLVRTNISAVPMLTVYGLQDAAGNPAGNGTVAQGTAPLLGNGQWEEVIIKAEGIPAAAATSNQVHLQPLGNMKGEEAVKTPGAYLDIAAWAAFPNLASAKAYNIKGAAGMQESSQNTGSANTQVSTAVTAPLLVRTQKAKAIGNIKPSMNAEEQTQSGVVYSRITFNNTTDKILFDAYGLPKFSVESPGLCFKFLVRTNCKDMPAPMLILYALKDENGESAGNGTVVVAEKPIESDGIWQEMIIKVTGIPAAAVTSAQIHFQPFGNTKGEAFFENGVPLNADAYFDIAGWAVFSNVESAMAYDLTAACSVSN